MTKTELRSIYLAKQKALSPQDRAEKSRRIALNFFESTDLSRVRVIHCFVPIEKFNEVDTTPIIHAVWATSPQVCVAAPRVNFETGEMESYIYTPDSEMAENAWGIREPAGKTVADADIDLVLVPGLAFDRSGHRVGYGKGFYDRFLKRCRHDCAKYGLSYFAPVAAITDVHDGDATLDRSITPDGIFAVRIRRSGDLPV